MRFRLVKSREAVILLSWKEKVSTWSQRTSASPSLPSPTVPQVGIKTRPSDGGMERWRDGGVETPESPAGALIHRGFSHQPQESGAPALEEGPAVFKTTTLSKINRRRFTFQLSILC